MCEEKEQEGLREYAAMIREQKYQLENDLARYLFSLGGGIAVLSVTLFSVLPKPLHCAGFLVASWICSAVTLCAVFTSIKCSIKSRERAFEIAQSSNPDFSKLGKENAPIKLCDNIAFGSGILALLLLGIFAANNIGDRNGKSEQQERNPCPYQEGRSQHSSSEREIGSIDQSGSQTNSSNRLRADQNP